MADELLFNYQILRRLKIHPDGHDMLYDVNSLQILTQSIAKIYLISEQFFLSYRIVIQNLGFFKRIRNSSEFVF